MIGKLSELQKEKNEQCTQRHELAVERLRTVHFSPSVTHLIFRS